MKFKKEEIPKEMDSKDFSAHETAMGNMNVGYEIFRKDIDMTPAFKGLPDNRCQSEHWGYILKGRLEADYGDHKEMYSAGDVYYMKPGHIPRISAGTEVIEFSPKQAYDKTMEIVARNMIAVGAR